MRNKIFFLLVACFLCTGCVSKEVQSLGNSMFSQLFFIIPLVLVVIFIIFMMNRFIIDEQGSTDNNKCSVVGLVLLPSVFLIAFSMKFGFGWVSITLAIILGIPIGWFSYVLDELLEEFWENKKYTIPGILGLVFGGWVTIFMFTGVWLEGNMYITHKAADSRVVIEHYVDKTCIDSDGNAYDCSGWEYARHIDKMVFGNSFPILKEGIDFTLGWHDGYQERVSSEEAYLFIGGYLFSEDDDVWREFRWLMQEDAEDMGFILDKVQVVRSNYFGNPIKNGGVVKPPKHPLPEITTPELPWSKLPPGSFQGKIIYKGFDVLAMLFKQREYKSLLYTFLIATTVLFAILFFVPQLRPSVITFMICSSIILFLIILFFAARAGSIPGLGRKKSGGSGGFGGRSGSL